MNKILFVIVLTLLFQTYAAYGGWVYTPEESKWKNSKYGSKNTPRNQFIYASRFEKEKNFGRAAREYKKIAKEFPTSNVVSKALYKAAECYEKNNNYYRAYLTYQELLEKDPAYEDYEDIVRLQFKIGNLFLSGKKRKLWKFSVLPATEQAIEIFEKVIKNLPFSALAPKAQFNIGLAYEKMEEYETAIKAYEKVLSKYSGVDEAHKALFRQGVCAYQQSYGAEYDRSSAQKSLRVFERFLKKYPHSDLAPDAEAKIKVLREREAEGNYNIGLYYEKADDLKAATVYYRDVITKYPETEYALKAETRLNKIKKAVNK